MSVIVKGMKMPITCTMCDLAHAMKNSEGIAKLACGATGRWQDEYMRRPSWCPLVELTAEDATKLLFQNWEKNEYLNLIRQLLNSIGGQRDDSV